MRIYLHIGTHKTGSTAIQWALAHSPEALGASGVIYPSAGRPQRPHGKAVGHHGLAWGLTRSDHSPDPWPELLEELDASSHPTAVISSEEFQALESPEHFSALRERLAGHEARIVVYLRRQDELLHASYCTAVLTQGEARPFGEYRRSVSRTNNYQRRLAVWERVFGRDALIVRPYERRQLKGHDSVEDFVAQIGLRRTSDLRRSPKPLVNRSYPRNVIECVRQLRVADASEEAIADLIEVCGYVYGDRPADADTLPPSRRAALLERFQESNSYVAHHYLGRKNGRLFDDLGVGDEDAWMQRYKGPGADVTALIEDANRELGSRG